MKLTKETKNDEAAALMGDYADSIDGCILIGLLYRAGIDDTDDVCDTQWAALLNETQRIRRDFKESY
ncbi:MAG: hypothetical protein ACRCUH_10195 [Shewanella sp.]